VSIRPILLWPDPLLSAPCAMAEAEGTTDLIADLFDTMYAAPGRGLAAPQIGVLQRVFVVDVAWKEGARQPHAFVNPVLRDASPEQETREEQCLSIPDRPVAVSRPVAITLDWQTPEGASRSGRFEGILARCILHELDHLDGRLILDHVPGGARADAG
jgi:peptide deformylase